MKSEITAAFRKRYATLPEDVRKSYRVVGLLEPDNVIVWFWIGPHEQYETLLANL